VPHSMVAVWEYYDEPMHKFTAFITLILLVSSFVILTLFVGIILDEFETSAEGDIPNPKD